MLEQSYIRVYAPLVSEGAFTWFPTLIPELKNISDLKQWVLNKCHQIMPAPERLAW